MKSHPACVRRINYVQNSFPHEATQRCILSLLGRGRLCGLRNPAKLLKEIYVTRFKKKQTDKPAKFLSKVSK